MRIWKYALDPSIRRLEIRMPPGSTPLTVQVQGDRDHGRPYLWCLVDEGFPEGGWRTYAVVTIGTGHQANHVEGMKYLGSYQILGGGFVGHVFWDETPDTEA